MKLFNVFKYKQSLFKFDEGDDIYKAEINGILFVCEKVEKQYEKYALQLAEMYETKLIDIINFMLPDIKRMFEIEDITHIKNSLGKPMIDLDREIITYLHHTLDNMHIIDVEFGGLFSEFYYTIIEG